MGIGVVFILQKMTEDTFFSKKKREFGKIVEDNKIVSIYLSIYYIYICIYIYSYSEIDSLYQEQAPLPNLACGAHFQFNNDDLFENVDWN